MTDNRLEAVALGLTEIARVYEGGKRIDTKELCAGLRNYAAVIRVVTEGLRSKGPDVDCVKALSAAAAAVGALGTGHEEALKSLVAALVSAAVPPSQESAAKLDASTQALVDGAKT